MFMLMHTSTSSAIMQYPTFSFLRRDNSNYYVKSFLMEEQKVGYQKLDTYSRKRNKKEYWNRENQNICELNFWNSKIIRFIKQ